MSREPNHFRIVEAALRNATIAKSIHWSFASGLVCCAVLLQGCGRQDGPKVVPVQGVVVLNGEPLPNATVRFQPVDGSGTYSVGQTDKDGKFELNYSRSKKGALLGENRVSITTGNPNNEDENGNPKPIPEILPATFHRESTLVSVVKEKGNHFEFDLIADLKKRPKSR